MGATGDKQRVVVAVVGAAWVTLRSSCLELLHANRHVDGFGRVEAGRGNAVYSRCGVFAGVGEVYAARRDERDVRVDGADALYEVSELACGNLVKLDAVDLRARELDGTLGRGFHEELLLDAAALDLGDALHEGVEPAHERHMVLEDQDSFGKAEPVGERAARHDGLGEQVLASGHALARRENLAARIGRMGRIDHRARLGCNGGKVVERVEAHFPDLMERTCGALYPYDRLAGLRLATRCAKYLGFASGVRGKARDDFRPGYDAVLAREILHFSWCVADTQYGGREVDIGNVLLHEVIESTVG